MISKKEAEQRSKEDKQRKKESKAEVTSGSIGIEKQHEMLLMWRSAFCGLLSKEGNCT